MAYFSSKDHCDHILDALQNRSCYEVSLVGDDGVGSLSDSLWLFSPLVRSIIDSLNSINDNIIILPDFSHDIIKTGLDIIGGVESEVLLFNSSVKEFLELLGIDLKHVETLGNSEIVESGVDREDVTEDNQTMIPTENIKREEIRDDDVEDDDDEDKMQDLLMAHNPDFDSSEDEEETELEENIKIKENKILKDGNEEQEDDNDDFSDDEEEDCNAADDEYDDDLQNLLLMDQDLSDSDDENDPINKENLKEERDITDDDEGSDINKTESVLNNKASTDGDIDKVKSDLQEEKLKEVEDLLVRENDAWKCKACGKISLKKSDLKKHAEIHVSGLSYPCYFCNKICTTRTQLVHHKKKKHRQDNIKVTKVRSKQAKFSQKITNKDYLNAPSKLQAQKLREVEDLLIEENGIWECKVCSKTYSYKGNLRLHADTHISGLSFPCKLCDETFTTRRLRHEHTDENHPNEKRKMIRQTDLRKIKLRIEKNKIAVLGNNEERDNINKEKMEEVKALVIKSDDLWKCKDCGYKNSTKTRVYLHAEQHVKGLSYPCTQCSKICPTKISLISHRQTHVSGVSYPCSQCEETFDTQNRRKYHVKRSHRNRVRRKEQIVKLQESMSGELEDDDDTETKKVHDVFNDFINEIQSKTKMDNY